MDQKDTMLEILDAISNIIVKKEVETEENEEMKELYNEALALESKVIGYLENEEFIKNKENTSKIITLSMICSRIESAVMKVVKEDMFNTFRDKTAGGDEDGE